MIVKKEERVKENSDLKFPESGEKTLGPIG